MRIAVFAVFSLVLNSAIAQTSSSSNPNPISAFNCEDLTSQIQTLNKSSRSKKEKFSCILNLLKSALTDELETPQCQEERKDRNSYKTVLEEKVCDACTQAVPTKETNRENTNGEERELNGKLVYKPQDKTRNIKKSTRNLEVPSMIPIFKPRPVIRNNFDNINSARPRSIPVAPEAVPTHSNAIVNAQKFTIPCQRAADVLDMSIAMPREATDDKLVKTAQTNLKPKLPVPSSSLANQTPTAVSVHCADSDDPVSILFKPKAITLTQLYGNLLKKITITVLVPYHMSKMGQQ